MNNWVDLYLESATDYSVTLVRGGQRSPVTLAEAKQLWDSGRVRDFNLAFERLARYGFDLDAVKAYYQRKREKDAR